MADITITASAVIPSVTSNGFDAIAGETLAAGEWVYIKAADQKLYKAQCDGTAEEAAVVGMMVNSAAAGQTGKYVNTIDVTVGAVLTASTLYFLSATAGKMCPEADLVTGNKKVLVGHGKTTSSLATTIIRGFADVP